jgi:hypothetical protein
MGIEWKGVLYEVQNGRIRENRGETVELLIEGGQTLLYSFHSASMACVSLDARLGSRICDTEPVRRENVNPP